MPVKKKKNVKRKTFIKGRSDHDNLNPNTLDTIVKIPAPKTVEKNPRFSPQLPTYRNLGLSAKEKSFIICSCQTKLARYRNLKNIAYNAIIEHKIFTIYGACAAVRKALVERGWVEKIPASRMNLIKLQNGGISKLQMNDEMERLLLSTLVDKYPSNFIWHAKDELTNFNIERAADCRTLENKLRTDTMWTTKQGLCLSMKKNYWFYIDDVAEVIGPRSYNTSDKTDVDDFEKDYRITACTSLLKWVLLKQANKKSVFTDSGQISINILVFALNRCKEYIFRKQNRDIDQPINNVSSAQWDTFLKNYHQLIEKNDVFESDKENKVPLYLVYSKFLLKEIFRYRPQASCEGYHNIWIVKPAHNSRGRGIRMASRLKVIQNLINNKANTKYVIQKYIEDPLLIHETKFDIRQYYLVTSTYPLIIWMYEDCYLKFSSQKYDLMNYHESIHLTNNAVQRKYTNCNGRHAELPAHNMWSSDKYKSYLNSIGKDKVWDNIVYPGMRKTIIGVMLSCQDSLPVCKDRFELYGCDFILDKMYTPWLIEINSAPDLTNTTLVTAQICPAVLADIIKVVIDYPRNDNASTGKFECIYHQPMTTPRYGPAIDLCARGYALPDSYFYRGPVPKLESGEDIVCLSIENANNPQVISDKITEYYNRNTMIVKPQPDESEKNTSTDLCSSLSDYELAKASKKITEQLEGLIDKLNSKNSGSGILITRSQSLDGINKIEGALKASINRLASLVVVSLTQDDSETGSDTIIPFNEEADGKLSSGTITEVNTIKKILDNYGMIQKELKNQSNLKITNSNQDGSISKSQNIILEATTDLVAFIKKKEKEYLGELIEP